MKGDTKLKDFRNRTGLEQKEMAKEIHVSPSYYCKVETGYRKPSCAFLLKFKDRFPDANIDELFFSK